MGVICLRPPMTAFFQPFLRVTRRRPLIQHGENIDDILVERHTFHRIGPFVACCLAVMEQQPVVLIPRDKAIRDTVDDVLEMFLGDEIQVRWSFRGFV